ncbi:unnamed protein product [Paramecium octaurelia]|uniref:Transmembrane protein n=1 Tax=Paramecium octaurelia TaxID=43137 RepID=A0A8S1THL4_PAROT|nr:unnamed protein product [Paramecium octaurelia]
MIKLIVFSAWLIGIVNSSIFPCILYNQQLALQQKILRIQKIDTDGDDSLIHTIQDFCYDQQFLENIEIYEIQLNKGYQEDQEYLHKKQQTSNNKI